MNCSVTNGLKSKNMENIIADAISKMSGDNVRDIICTFLLCGTLVYVANCGKDVEMSDGEKKIIIKGSEAPALS